jgi:hypothetical protein
MTTLESALKYLRRGWRVTPAQGKAPFIPNWPEIKTTEYLINVWFSEVRPERWNVAICTGPASGIFALDIDGPEGEKAIEGRDIPPGPQVRTGGGGAAYLF